MAKIEKIEEMETETNSLMKIDYNELTFANCIAQCKQLIKAGRGYMHPAKRLPWLNVSI